MLTNPNHMVETSFDVIPFGIYVVDVRDHSIVFMNRTMKMKRGDFTGQTCYKALFMETEPCPHCTIPDFIQENGQIDPSRSEIFELFNPVDDRWYQMQDKALAWPDGRLVKCSIAVDISELKQMQNELAEAHAQLALKNRELRSMAMTDLLTGIYNRVKLEEVFARETDRAERYGQRFSVILLDLDRFKAVNDTYGHNTGDDVLAATADILRTNVRKTDVLGRWGGEEFCIICPETEPDDALTLAEKLRTLFESHRHSRTGTVTGSFGVASFEPGDRPEDVVRRADKALYRAKEAGRNTVILAD